MKLNKFFSLLLVMFIFSYVSAFCEMAQVITVLKKDGGPNGYAQVSEYHNTATGQHDLSCTGAGYSSCTWVTPPSISMSLPDSFYDDMVDYANQQMNNGVYSGTNWDNFYYDNHYYARSVSWSGMEPQNSEIQINMILIPDF